MSKCLDNDAGCEMRVDQVSTSRVVVKQKPKHKAMGSEYHPDFNMRSPPGTKYKNQEFGGSGNTGMAKSEFNFPLNNHGKTR